MSRIVSALAVMSLGASVASAADEAFPPARAAVECAARGGLPNFFAKLEKGGPVKVAYLGGSITEQPGWRIRSLAYFQKLYPKAKLTEIHAAIGGTGSNLGVLRIEHDVFKGKPDLLFVEFAVNDGGANPNEIIRNMEGIVRKTWKAFPNCDICFVYTFTIDKRFNSLKEGKLNRSAATMELVADKYQIPSIHLGLEVVRLEKEGKLLMKASDKGMTAVSGDSLNQNSKAFLGPDGKIPFSNDGVHPYPNTGHQLYEEAIERSIPLIQAAGKSLLAHALPEPLDPKNYENTVMLPIDSAVKAGSWSKLPDDKELGKQFSKYADSLWKASPGASLSFKFKGSAATIYHLFGPGCGSVEVVVDGKPLQKPALCIDSYCTYYRLAVLKVGGDLDPNAIHEVSIKVRPDKLDKSAILFPERRDDLARNPAKYEPLDWYPCAIFLVGELVK